MFKGKKHHSPVSMYALKDMLEADCCYLRNNASKKSDTAEITIDTRKFPLCEMDVI